MGHQSQHIALAIADPGNIEKGSIGIGRFAHAAVLFTITENDLFVVLKGFESSLINEVIPLHMGNGHLYNFSRRDFFGEGYLLSAGLESHGLTEKMQTPIAEQCAGQK